MMTRAARTVEVELAEQMDGLAKAYRVQLAARWGLRALAAGLLMDIFLVAASRQGVLPLGPYWLAVPPLALALLAVLGALLRHLRPIALASHADRVLGLQERLTTAIELADRQSSGNDIARSFAREQLADTVGRLREFRPSVAFPFAMQRKELVLLILPAVALLVISTLPRSTLAIEPNQTRVQEVIKQEAERVALLAAESETQRDPADSQMKAAVARALREASKNLETKPNSAESAVAALADAEAKIASLQNPRADDLRQALARAADALRRDGATSEAGNRLAQNDSNAAADALSKLASQASGLNQAQKSATAQALKAAGANASRFDSRLGESLRKAGEALASSDPLSQAALENAADNVRQSGGQAASQEMVEKALAQLEAGRQSIGKSGQSTAERAQSRPPSPESAAGSQVAERSSGAAAPSSRGGDENESHKANDGNSANGEAGTPSSTDGGKQEASSKNREGGQGAGRGTLNNTNSVFAPDSLRGRQEQDTAPGFDRPSVSSSDTSSAPTQGEATVDYRQVYADYRDRATAATQDRYIPLDLKGLVKDYFSALDPTAGGSPPGP